MLAEHDESRRFDRIARSTGRPMNPRPDRPETAPALAPSRLSVIVVTHQSEGCIEACLQSIQAQRPTPSEVIVVDSGSHDATAVLVARHETVRWMPLGENVGFAVAANRGVASTTGDLVAILNADVALRPGWIAAMSRAAERRPSAASFGSVQLLAPEGTIDGLGDCLHFSGLVWRRGRGGRVRPREDLEAFSACGAAAVFRRAELVECGGFEESFCCYFEDVDLGFRLRLAGHDCVNVAEAICDHLHGHASGGPRSDFATYHGHRNMVWAYLRCMPDPLLWPLLPAFIAAQAACLVATAVRGQGRVAARAKIDALRALGRVLGERRAIQRSRRASAASIANSLSWALLPRRGKSRGRSAVRRAAPLERGR
jgi:GT2 family glycosyltransferase